MRYFGSILTVLLAMSAVGQAQITKTATFENFIKGHGFNPAFTDMLSGITFENSTNATGGFVIDGAITVPLSGNYLTSGIAPIDALGVDLGFVGNLAASADRVSLQVAYDPAYGNNGYGVNISSLLLQGFTGRTDKGT